ncbi:hypothetical protein EDD16DRAFT_1084414 [Pisolithus croceorrhizus]|nr:hypothetical protein EDD16DRAFT_1084414 [Pisolithus croceorrhizus]
MALNGSPRKTVPLASGDDDAPRRSGADGGQNVTRRVFYCGVVVEGCEGGKRLPDDVQDLVLSLGDPWLGQDQDNILPSASETTLSEDITSPKQRPRPTTDASALLDVINELVNTERSYVKRLRILKHDYADPLRQFSRSKSTAILPPYEAKTLFGNVDNLLPVNEAFLADLEKMMEPDGPRTVGGVGDVALKHFKDLRGFEHYKQYYAKREEAQTIFEREMMKKSSGFAAYVDRIKYSNADARNRVGLRELLMDPVQRIPRYTLLFRTMVKLMGLEDPQRALIIEAGEIASKIALAETDEQTQRAAVMYSLSATIDGFPAGLISNSRRFIDCIDVDDVIIDAPMGASTSASSFSATVLHCTLFLFDDKLMIAKRPGNGEKSGTALAGLDEVQKLAKTGGLPLGLKKSGMSCKGVFDITDIVAADVGGAELHVYLENPPHDQGDRWSGRPFRSLSVVFPPAPINLDPCRTTAEKERFLDNLWSAQAKYRTRYGQSVVLCADETEVEAKGSRTTVARTYFNVYQRTAFLQEIKKTKIVMHIDPLGTADPIPFGMGGPPYVVVRVQPMAGEISRYSVTSTDPSGDPEEEIVQTARIAGRIVQTIHQYGLFKFRTGNDSRPATPTASARSRAHIFSLDAISRNFFSSRPVSSKSELFGGSISGHRRSRSKSTTSRSSTYTQTTTTGDGSLTKFSCRSGGSASTAATTMASGEDDSFSVSRSTSSRRKLVKRGPSPSSARCSPEPLSRPASRSISRDNHPIPDDAETSLDRSEEDLTSRLELARRNSNQHGKPLPPLRENKQIKETIYEEGPPVQLKRGSRMSIRKEADSPISSESRPQSPATGVSSLAQSSVPPASEIRRFGPRSPSLPPTSPASTRSQLAKTEDSDVELDDDTFRLEEPSLTALRNNVPSSPLLRNKQQLSMRQTTTDTPISTPVSSIEPLSIKKKSSVRSGHSIYSSPRRSYRKMSPLSKATARIISPRKASLEKKANRPSDPLAYTEYIERVTRMVSATKEDIDGSHRALKRIKLDVDEMKVTSYDGPADPRRSPSPDKALSRTPQRVNPPLVTKEAQARLDEMRQLISKRQMEGTPRIRPYSIISESTNLLTPDATGNPILSRLEESIKDADLFITRAATSHNMLQDCLEQLFQDLKTKAEEYDKTRAELQNAKRQCELVKSLLVDATAEKEIMYEAFNEELDAMYKDANLPHDQAWQAMTKDLSKTKESRNSLSHENSKLKRRIAELEAEKKEWTAVLQTHKLTP